MIMSPKAMSEKIRMKRMKLKDDGVDNMVDTAALPQMNPQDILNLKQQAQMEETMGIEPHEEGPSDPADEDISGTSQDLDELKKLHGRMKAMFDRMS